MHTQSDPKQRWGVPDTTSWFQDYFHPVIRFSLTKQLNGTLWRIHWIIFSNLKSMFIWPIGFYTVQLGMRQAQSPFSYVASFLCYFLSSCFNIFLTNPMGTLWSWFWIGSILISRSYALHWQPMLSKLNIFREWQKYSEMCPVNYWYKCIATWSKEILNSSLRF